MTEPEFAPAEAESRPLWLVAAGEVDDAEAAHPHREVAGGDQPGVVGAAVDQGRDLRGDRIRGITAPARVKPRNPADIRLPHRRRRARRLGCALSGSPGAVTQLPHALAATARPI